LSYDTTVAGVFLALEGVSSTNPDSPQSRTKGEQTMNMKRRDITHHLRNTRNVVVAVAATLILAASVQAMDSEKVVFTFGGGKSGAYGGSHFVADSAGNLYGTTAAGGNSSTICEPATGVPGCGVVFKLIRREHGSWQETILHTFTGGSDGAVPVGGVIFDSAGNLYGTTWYGGDKKPAHCHAVGFIPGCGVVYKLTPTASGPWKETVLYSFTGGNDGSLPFAGVILDSSGNLYGTATFYGDVCCGVVFKLTPTGQSPWTETVLYAFTGGADGNAPYSDLAFDSNGNLYGTTLYGGDTSLTCFFTDDGCGVVFKLTPTSKGPWTETVLHTFKDGADGAGPLLGVTLDHRGNVYGTTFYGGNTTAINCVGGYGINAPAGCGVVYKLTKGSWDETVLHAFTDGRDGASAVGQVIFDSAGNLYGMTGMGGDLAVTCPFGDQKNNGCGVIFKLTPTHKGPWTETILYAFTGGADGGEPESNLLFDSAGSILGITEGGGKTSECTGNFAGAGCGVVFKIAQGHNDQF
jgi:hypothetical protein